MNDGRAFCKHCEYKLTGLARNVCPECGQPFDPDCRHTFTRHPDWRRWQRRVLCCLLAVTIAYVGSYYCLVQAQWKKTLNSGVVQIRFGRMSTDSASIVGEVLPTYRVGGGCAASVYSPLHELDRRLRPSTWTVTIQRQQPLEWAGL